MEGTKIITILVVSNFIWDLIGVAKSTPHKFQIRFDCSKFNSF